jgi:hypothetical protein
LPVSHGYFQGGNIKEVAGMDSIERNTLARRELAGLVPEGTCLKQIKEEMADKVLLAERLSVDDKRLIYKLLTGKTAPKNKRGPGTTGRRDKKLAIDFLEKRRKVNNVQRLIKELAIKHNLPGSEGVQLPTFYKALNRGIDRLKDLAEAWLEAFEHQTEYGDLSVSIAKAKKDLALISEYRDKVS